MVAERCVRDRARLLVVQMQAIIGVAAGWSDDENIWK
ncbi:hypothetical protein BJB45_09565 [Halomonas huangheensis]|uniref:Uncharacterized protein n=1 Tax=Halomonas huangheensis TaxID=1178482 RepID=W1N9L6_9GAMM|nr:hypothetical protein BJB45_09565 [Halomonas huangheensis]